MAIHRRFFLALVALAAGFAAAACRHGAQVAPIERGELRGVLLAPAPAGRETQGILADGPIAALVANNSMGLVANNSMGLDGLLPPSLRRVLGAQGGQGTPGTPATPATPSTPGTPRTSGVPVIGALVRLLDGQGRPIPGASIGFTASSGAFRLLGVPIGRIAVVDAGWSVQGQVRTELAIVSPVAGRTQVLVDAPSSMAAARALAGADHRLEHLDTRRVDAAAALLRARPDLLGGVDLGSRAALAAAFAGAAAADPEIAEADPAPDFARVDASPPEPAASTVAIPSMEPQPSPAADPSPTPQPGSPGPTPQPGTPGPTPQAGMPGPAPSAGPSSPTPFAITPNPSPPGNGEPSPTPDPSEPGVAPGNGDPNPAPGNGDPGLAPGNGDPGLAPDNGDPGLAPDNGDPPLAPDDRFDLPLGDDPLSGIIPPDPDSTGSPPQ